mmetsp:Transcript_37039/g.64517  ORF Transcript_37039/g.64517 Transcript_37039/m.64517 type:complete len:337 (+) Transcript_37039:54-1064(+)
MEVMKKDMISRFQGKFKSIFACVIEDSTNEATQNSFEVMSPRFLMHCKGDEDKARKMWKDMLSWRQHNEIDTLLERSVPHFAAMKRHCPSAFHGRTREGKLVFYERVGAYQIGSMKKDKLGPKHVTSFTAFIQEYIFTHLITNDEERYMSVLDVRGISWGVVSGDSINAMKATSETIQNNFPERVSNLMIINAPEWFTGAWKFVEKILAANIERVTIHSEEETLAALQEYLEDENIPACYGGQCQHLLGAHPFERALWEAARAGPPTVFEGAAPTPGGAGGAVATASPAPSGLGALGGGAPAAGRWFAAAAAAMTRARRRVRRCCCYGRYIVVAWW